jgi:hypothetical protein
MAISDAIVLTITIPSGDTVSDAVFVGSARVTGLLVPTIDNSKISFQGSADNDLYYELVDETLGKNEINAGTGEYFVSLHSIIEGPAWLKLVLGSSQTADRTFKLVLKAH